VAAGLGCWEDSVGITPLILRPFGRSGQELPVEYQVEPHFINFPVSTRVQLKKAIDRGQDLEISKNPYM
jgi:hypothetical protein